MSALILIAACVLLFWLLYVFYIAVMALRDRRDEGVLSGLDKAFGYPTLIVGLVIDALCNWVVMTMVLLEAPSEILVTKRLLRLARLPYDVRGLNRYRRWFARWLLDQIDQHDKKGGHDVPT